jgi:hypothetical protein
MNTSALLVALVVASSGNELNLSTDAAPELPRAGMGAIAPAALPAGAISAYGLLGAPDVQIGYRQGISILELEAKASFNYLTAAFALDVGLRMAVFKKGMLTLAPAAGVALVLNSGEKYFDTRNYGYTALRPRLGFYGSLAFSEVVSGIFLVEAPWAFAFQGGYQVTPTAGIGGEFQLNKELSGVVLGQVGVDVIKEPVGFAFPRAAWAVRLGLGYRFF